MLKDLDHKSKITKVIFYTSKDPDHLNDLDLLAKRSPIFPIYGWMKFASLAGDHSPRLKAI